MTTPASEKAKCEICKKDLCFQWSDTHGVGVCVYCGLPYKIFFYEDEGDSRKRVEKAPEVAVKEEWLPLARKYYDETKRRVFPCAFDMGVGHGGRSYSGSTAEDVSEFNNWMEAHKEEHPKLEVEP